MKQLIIFMLGFLVAIYLPSSAFAKSPLKTQTDKLSYVVGLQMGTSFKAQGTKINPKQMLKGLQDGLSGAKPLVSSAERVEIMQQYQKAMMAKVQAEMKKQAAIDSSAGAKFLAANAKKSGVVTTKSGLQYKILNKGKGVSPTASDTVTVDYEGKLVNGKIFDSSYKRGQPVTFPVNGVIKGWTEALQKMHPGATWMLYIPADLAYGNREMGGIPPNSTLIFKVHLISVKK